jgi:hypothetical protein
MEVAVYLYSVLTRYWMGREEGGGSSKLRPGRLIPGNITSFPIGTRRLVPQNREEEPLSHTGFRTSNLEPSSF